MKTYRWPMVTYMKRCSISLIIREMQIKTKRWYHLTPVRIAIINKARNNNCWWSCGEKKESLCTVGGNVISTTAMENSMKFLQNIKNRTAAVHGVAESDTTERLNWIVWPSNSTSSYLPKGNENTNSKPYLHLHIHSNIINNSQDMKAA